MDGKRHGPHCITRYKSGNVYEGPYVNDKRHGKAVFTLADGTRFICGFENNKFAAGPGEKYFADGGVYKGELNEGGEPHGKGVWDFADGWHYEGECDDGLCHGIGIMTLPDGKTQAGRFEKGQFIGPEEE